MRPVPGLLTLVLPAVLLAACVPPPPHSRDAAPAVQPEANAPKASIPQAGAPQAGAPQASANLAGVVGRWQPASGSDLVVKGSMLYARGSVLEARAAYQQALAANPDDVDARIGLGRTLIRSDPRAAEAAFLAALARQPTNEVALNDLGVTRDLQGRHEEARNAYRMALLAEPGNTDVRTNLNLSLVLSGEGGNAEVEDRLAAAPSQPAVAGLTPSPQAVPVAAPSAAPEGAVPAVSQPAVSQPAVIASLDPAPDGGYVVQVGALDSSAAAQNAWQGLSARWPELFDRRQPTMRQAYVHQRLFWRLRTGGFASAADAMTFCRRLRAAGAGCWAVAITR